MNNQTTNIQKINEIQLMNSNLTCDDSFNKININEHYLYLILNILIVIAFSLPTGKIYLILLYLLLTIAYLLQCIWSWQEICGSNLFTWSVAFFILNSFNSIKLIIQKKEVAFSVNLLNNAYQIIFNPLAVSKDQIKKLFSPELAKIICLAKGETYAIENTTKTDKLGLLLDGNCIVTSGDNILHSIEPMQFVDSPEFHSKHTFIYIYLFILLFTCS